MKEEWRAIEGFPLYEVSNFGRVRSKSKRVYLMKTPPFVSQTLKRGYLSVSLNGDRKGNTSIKYVHRLVLEAFLQKPKTKKEANHIDGNKLNNHIRNLEWVTSKENKQHALKLGLKKVGEESYQAKLKESDVKRIRKLMRNKVHYRKIANHFGVSPSCLYDIAKGKNWKYLK